MTRSSVSGALASNALGFGILCYVSSKDYRWAAVALTGFWGFNILVWRYMVGVLKGSVHGSYASYGRSRRYIDMEKVRVVERYIDGQWQWWRFGLGAALVLFSKEEAESGKGQAVAKSAPAVAAEAPPGGNVGETPQ